MCGIEAGGGVVGCGVCVTRGAGLDFGVGLGVGVTVGVTGLAVAVYGGK